MGRLCSWNYNFSICCCVVNGWSFITVRKPFIYSRIDTVYCIFYLSCSFINRFHNRITIHLFLFKSGQSLTFFGDFNSSLYLIIRNTDSLVIFDVVSTVKVSILLCYAESIVVKDIIQLVLAAVFYGCSAVIVNGYKAFVHIAI